jgi:hypothetical protein
MSDYRLQIVFADGSKVRLRPGRQDEEGDLITACVNRIVSKGVGVFRTEASVKQAIEEGLREVFLDLKRGVRP